ncbi:PREDICTED: S-type anion channel SLAH1-like [Nicotiana attenuata]|uniref:S-type anion channel slah1 n=1 Tax=Nicotiana attenuata TaxID=49451 RepID=A0A1J6JTQ6_NICAT|nr:PREDICTED: S-type anion channel SLAH1-like [Nicotiana attenuata]OIT21106.1 s-type anion channel slah1 [Nicotiana attenuata]
MGEEVFESTIKVTISDDTMKSDISKKSSSPSLLTKLHAGYFRISLSLGGQALLWKVLIEHLDKSQTLHHLFHTLPSTTFLLLWWISLCTLIILSFLYILRCIFHFSLVKSEFLHPVGVNYLFAPWISWLLLLQSAPFSIPHVGSCQVFWWIFVVPVGILDVKIYGQWFTTEKRFLSMVANPTSQLSVLGNLTGAWVASKKEWKESAVCIFTLGLTHYLVVFITLYQRLSGSNSLPAMLRPSFFLFVAAPSMASLAWASISGDFDMSCRMLFFLSLFLFTSLVCRPALFKKSMRKFNVAWWAYSFPLSFLALASAQYAHQVKGPVSAGLMLLLSALSVLVFVGLTVSTALNLDMLLADNDRYLNFTKRK